jgi:N-methylhydantoinase A
MAALECAAAIVRIVDAQMADLVRKVLVEAGHDPRRFVVLAYGGAGPVHVGAFGADIGVPEAIVSPHAAAFSALGLASAPYVRIYERSSPGLLPGDPAALRTVLDGLELEAKRDFKRTGLAGTLQLDCAVDLRYVRQTHQLGVPAAERLAGVDEVLRLMERFEREYERVYGAGTGYAGAGMEAVTCRVIASAGRASHEWSTRRSAPGSGAAAQAGSRLAVFGGAPELTPVFSFRSLQPGTAVTGPALVDGQATTVVVHPGQTAEVDDRGNLRLRFSVA